MKPLKDYEYEVEIFWCIEGYAPEFKIFGTGIDAFYIHEHRLTPWRKTERGAINLWRKFAKVNGITNYKILIEQDNGSYKKIVHRMANKRRQQHPDE